MATAAKEEGMTTHTRLAHTSLLGKKVGAFCATKTLCCANVRIVTTMNEQLDNGEVSGEVNGLATE